MADKEGLLRVQVCYPHPGAPQLFELRVAAGTTLLQAVQASGLPRLFPGIDPAGCKLGIHGKLRPADTVLREGDRVEIYRPLLADPREARRRRVQKRGA
jgi:putative ubiquitin-RnfH superfamily antitoxin RatB of RatAB toxin-antitoxin module